MPAAVYLLQRDLYSMAETGRPMPIDVVNSPAFLTQYQPTPEIKNIITLQYSQL